MSSIEEIVIKIQNGEDLKNELYGRVYKLLYRFCKHYAESAAKLGYDIDDLFSVSWFGVENAIKGYRADKGYKFATYLGYHVKNAIRGFLGYGRAENAQRFISLYEPVRSADNLTLADSLEDVRAAEAFENAENFDYYNALHSEIDKLPQEQKEVIKRRFWGRESMNEIARSKGVSRSAIFQRQGAALRSLRKSPKLKVCYYDEVAYRHIGVKAFNNTWTSSTEWAAIKAFESELSGALGDEFEKNI